MTARTRNINVQLPYDFINRKVFIQRLKTVADGDDITEDGKLFQVQTAATGKERSPSIERLIGGTTIAGLGRRLPSKSATR